MPKIVDYPRAPIDRALQLAEVVDKLGGESTEESAADHMGNKVGGAFRSLIGAAVKYGLVATSKGRIKTEPLFQDYKLAYNDADRQSALRRAFLTVPLFASLAKRLEGKEIPPHFEKLLIREHGVPEDLAARLGTYFSEGARVAGVIGPNGIIGTNQSIITGTGVRRGEGNQPVVSVGNEVTGEPVNQADPDVAGAFVRSYTVRITGPGIDFRIAIKDDEDVDIVEAMLKKIRRLNKAQAEGEGKGGT